MAMASVFGRDYKGDNVLTNIFKEAAEFSKFFFEEAVTNFIALAKAEESNYLGLSGDNKSERLIGLVTAPLSVPAHALTYACSLPLVGLYAGLAEHDIESGKKAARCAASHKSDIM
jgi:hypothetical protein